MTKETRHLIITSLLPVPRAQEEARKPSFSFPIYSKRYVKTSPIIDFSLILGQPKSMDELKFSGNAHDQDVLRLIVSASLPFSIVNNPMFCIHNQRLRQSAKMPTQQRLNVLLVEEFRSAQAEFFSDLGVGTKVLLAPDFWTSPGNC